MKILTLNTHSWLEDNQLGKLELLVADILEERYDFIALQEINQTIKERKLTDLEIGDSYISSQDSVSLRLDNYAYILVNRLKEKGLNYYWTWSPSHIGYSKYDEGLAVLSLEPFKAKSKVVSTSKDYSSYKTRVALFVETSDTVFVNAHYNWWDEGFSYEWNNTLESISSNKSIIIAGDFNNDANVSGEGYSLMLENPLNLTDSYKISENTIGKYTAIDQIDGWEDSSGGRRIDYILVDKNSVVKKHHIKFDGINHSVPISDHFAVMVELEI